MATDTADDLIKVIEYFATSDIPLTPTERLEAIGATIRDWRWEQRPHEGFKVSD